MFGGRLFVPVPLGRGGFFWHTTKEQKGASTACSLNRSGLPDEKILLGVKSATEKKLLRNEIQTKKPGGKTGSP